MDKREEKRIKYFEDLDAWQVGKQLAALVYTITSSGTVTRDYGFIDQIRRAAVSVMSNIAEGHDRGSNKDFIRFLFIARGSAAEVRSLLHIGKQLGYVSEEDFRAAHELSIRCGQLTWGLIKHLGKGNGWKTGLTLLLLCAASILGPTLLERVSG